MVDRVTEIPLPGRTICSAAIDSTAAALRAAVPAFVAGPENELLGGTFGWLLRSVDGLADDERPAAATAGVPAVLMIHGPSGTGKTHLARGLVWYWHQRCGAASAEYWTAADFRHALVDAIRSESVAEFRRRVRDRQLLAIDGIDRLPKDDYLQRELRYTIDAYEESGGMIVVTSSHALGALRNLAVDVRSRLAAGLDLRLAPPDDAAKRRILRQASAALGRPLSEEASARLAAGVGGTANDLFGALFEMCSDRYGAAGSDVRRVERYLATRAARRPTLRGILRAVARYYAIPQKVLKSSSRRQSVVTARAMAVYLARELAGLSYERIGQSLGGRDHTTIIHNYRKIARQLVGDYATREAVDELCRILNNAVNTASDAVTSLRQPSPAGEI